MPLWGRGCPRRPLTCDWTFDVDVAFKHKGRSRLKSLLLQVRDLGLGRWTLVQERFRVNRGWMQDPYDTYDWLLEHHRGEQVTFHVLAANRNRPHDVGLNPYGTTLPQLVKDLSNRPQVVVRWHPGWGALEDPNVALAEQARVKPWPGMRCDEVRTHFLRGCPGRLWRQWVDMGVAVDSSLGWAHDVGFRAGTSRDFTAFDVKNNQALPLDLQPMVAMDEAMRGKLGWSASEAEQHLSAPVGCGGHCRRRLADVLAQHLRQRHGSVGGVEVNIRWHHPKGPEQDCGVTSGHGVASVGRGIGFGVCCMGGCGGGQIRGHALFDDGHRPPLVGRLGGHSRGCRRRRVDCVALRQALVFVV